MEKSVRSVMMRPAERSVCRNTFHIGMAVIANAFAYFCYANKTLGARFKYLAVNHTTKYMVAI